MRRLRVIAAAGLLAIGSAHASPILVDPTETGSTVNASITSSDCLGCFIDASLSDDVEEALALLDTGDSFTFDFFDLVLGGLTGGAEFAVEASLALASPSAAAGADGTGMFAPFMYVYSGVSPTWIQPDLIDLGDGTFLSITFEDLFELINGSTTPVSVTITRAAAIPQRETAALLIVGLMALWLATGRRRPIRRTGGGLTAAAA